MYKFRKDIYHHPQASSENTAMLDNTISRFKHAFDFTAVPTHWKPL